MTLLARLALQKNRTHLAHLRHGGERGPVEGLVRFVGVIENFPGQRRRHETKQFVRSQHINVRITASCVGRFDN